MNRLGGEWLSELQIGRDSRLFTEFYQPVDERGRYFVAPYASYGQSTRGVFIGENRVAEYDAREGRVGLDFGSVIGTWGEVRLGGLWRNIDAKVDTGSPVLPSLREDSAGVRLKIYGDQLDNAWFARSGHRTVISALVADEGMGSDQNYRRLEGDVTVAKSWGAHTFNANLSGGTDMHTDMPTYETFTLGGPLRLSGYRIEEFSGRRMGFGRLMYYNRAVALPDILGSGVYAGASLEAGRMTGNFANPAGTGTIFSGSVFIAADTFAGPAYFGFGMGEGGRYSLYLLLGAP
jgi:NTE family protein